MANQLAGGGYGRQATIPSTLPAWITAVLSTGAAIMSTLIVCVCVLLCGLIYNINKGYKFEPSVSDLQPLFPCFMRVSSVLLYDSEIEKTFNSKREKSKCSTFEPPMSRFRFDYFLAAT